MDGGATARTSLRVARELHDDLAQLMSGARIALALYRPSADDQSAASALLVTLDALVARSLEAVPRAFDGERPRALRQQGLAAALRMLAAEAGGAPTVSCEVPDERVDAAMDADAAAHVYRIVQEALTNAQRHAGARHVLIRARHIGDGLAVEVSDDGRGIDALATCSGYGLAGMHERAVMLGASLRVDCGSGVGTRVALTIPGDASNDFDSSMAKSPTAKRPYPNQV